ncbi:ABC transporter permease [Acidicapsa ligni]|uniref:ABC transporter permease n=1 Tax=Acidicapsa ligni TaxID=542300 RepID=UPI0021DF657E|nr:ABC transporter permease [Acidicapsa ligni]
MQSLADILGEVFRAMMANKLRTFLTMFGIAWGVGSLLVLVGLGEGFRSGQRRNLASVGNDVVMAFDSTIPALPFQHTAMRPYKLTLKDEADMRALPELRAVTATLNRSDLYEVSAWSNTSMLVFGVEPNFSQVRFVPVEQGRFLDNDDLTNRRRVAVLGSKAARMLYPGHPFLGESITINGTSFTVVGSVATIARGGQDFDDQKVYIPLSTMMELFAMKGENIPRDSLTTIQYQPTIKGDSTAAVAAVHRVLGRNHSFDPLLKEAFDEWDTIHTSKLVDKIFDAMDLFLGGVGVVTLGLGAVGIINIMLVSVTERTREIGLRKALGATSRSILVQFFLEGLILTTVSGIIGIGISAGFMAILQSLLTGKMPGFDPPQLVWWSAALAMGSLAVCGIVAGVYPASQAAALEPVEALRRE